MFTINQRWGGEERPLRPNGSAQCPRQLTYYSPLTFAALIFCFFSIKRKEIGHGGHEPNKYMRNAWDNRKFAFASISRSNLPAAKPSNRKGDCFGRTSLAKAKLAQGIVGQLCALLSASDIN